MGEKETCEDGCVCVLYVCMCDQTSPHSVEKVRKTIFVRTTALKEPVHIVCLGTFEQVYEKTKSTVIFTLVFCIGFPSIKVQGKLSLHYGQSTVHVCVYNNIAPTIQSKQHSMTMDKIALCDDKL